MNPARYPKRAKKTVTFADVAGQGAVGTVALFTVQGSIIIERLTARCTTLLTGALATVEVGVAGNTAALIAQTVGTDIDANEFWQDATPEVGVSPAIVEKAVCLSIIATVGTAAVTAGVIEFIIEWRPLSDNGQLSAA